MKRSVMVGFSLLGALALTSVVVAARIRVSASMLPLLAIDASGFASSESDTARPAANRLQAQFEVFSGDFAALGIDPLNPAASSVVLNVSTGGSVTLNFAVDRRVAGVGDVIFTNRIRGASAPIVPPGATGTITVNGIPAVSGTFH